jgi:hypothetical protein
VGFWPQNEKSYKLKNGGLGVKFGSFDGFGSGLGVVLGMVLGVRDAYKL